MVPLLKFYFHEEVRRAATSALPQLLRATQAAAEKGVQGASQVRFADGLRGAYGLLSAVRHLPDASVFAAYLQCLTRGI
jgi:hypothetical protein